MSQQAPINPQYLARINAYVTRCAAFSEEELATFDALLRPATVPKKTFLLSGGEICTFEAYICKGCIRTFYMDENGFEVVLQFAVEDWWVSDITSFNERAPSHFFIETLEECELLMLDFPAKEALLQQIPRFERVFRLMVQRNLAVTQERLLNTLSKTAQEKYLDFVARYPAIPQRVAQHHIAAYLGISP